VGPVLLIANYRLDRQQSMTRVAGLLENGLRSRGIDVRIIRPEPLFGLLVKGIPWLAKWLGYLDKYLVFPFTLVRAARGGMLVHILDHSNALYCFWLRSNKVVVTCNDLLAVRSALGEIPEHRTGFTGRLLQKWVLAGLRRADRIVCISEATKLDVLRLTGKPESEVSTIYLGLDPVFETDLRGSRNKKRAGAVKRAAMEKEFLFGSVSGKFACRVKNALSRELLAPYLLHVGSDTWYKNRPGVLRIYREVRRRLGRTAPDLIMVGSALEPKAPGVHYLEEVTDTMLADLYRNAALLLFPSLYEGFGWPVVEANACGCPAVISGIAPLLEAGGSAAALISDPRDIDEAADRVLEVLRCDNNTALGRREAAYLNACRFPSCEMIGQYLEIYAGVEAGE
jgi:glycosyltransferase involved in cell wall biosynthesis